jgi:hypothetical protein
VASEKMREKCDFKVARYGKNLRGYRKMEEKKGVDGRNLLHSLVFFFQEKPESS